MKVLRPSLLCMHLTSTAMVFFSPHLLQHLITPVSNQIKVSHVEVLTHYLSLAP